MNTKMLADFQISFSVPFKFIEITWNILIIENLHFKVGLAPSKKISFYLLQ